METSNKNLSRRNFIKLSGMTGAALTLGFYFPAKGSEAEIIKTETAENLGIELNAWISIDTQGKVTIINHRSEMGQGSFQSVPQIIAEELEVDLNDVNIVFPKVARPYTGVRSPGVVLLFADRTNACFN